MFRLPFWERDVDGFGLLATTIKKALSGLVQIADALPFQPPVHMDKLFAIGEY